MLSCCRLVKTKPMTEPILFQQPISDATNFPIRANIDCPYSSSQSIKALSKKLAKSAITIGDNTYQLTTELQFKQITTCDYTFVFLTSGNQKKIVKLHVHNNRYPLKYNVLNADVVYYTHYKSKLQKSNQITLNESGFYFFLGRYRCFGYIIDDCGKSIVDTYILQPILSPSRTIDKYKNVMISDDVDIEVFMSMAKQLIYSLISFSTQKIHHCDISPENICYDDETKTYKFIDWGHQMHLSKYYNDISSYDNPISGTPGYQPLELLFPKILIRQYQNLNEMKIDTLMFKTDVFSLGATLCEVLFNHNLEHYYRINYGMEKDIHKECYNKIHESYHFSIEVFLPKHIEETKKKYPNKLKLHCVLKLIQQMLDLDYTKRIDLNKLTEEYRKLSE